MAVDALIHYALPQRLSVGPRWLLFAVILALLIPITFSYHRGRYDVTKILTFVALGVITISLTGSLGLLIQGLPNHKDPPGVLLHSARPLWLANVLVFALWYWKLDAGGSFGTRTRRCPELVSVSPDDPAGARGRMVAGVSGLSVSCVQHQHRLLAHRHPRVGHAWAKVLMMIQSLVSLSVIALLAARAVNIL